MNLSRRAVLQRRAIGGTGLADGIGGRVNVDFKATRMTVRAVTGRAS